MKTIGITGGVGAGKSIVLDYIEKNFNAKVYYADLIAKDLQKKGAPCYEKIVALLSSDILDDVGEILPQKMAAKMFADTAYVEAVNGIIHPAVKSYVLAQIEECKQQGNLQYFVLEAALLIEDHYDEILDELWYIHTDASIRRKRLKDNRHYSDDKIDQIMAHQLPYEEFSRHCKVMITNNDNVMNTYRQIDSVLGGN